MLCLNRQSKHTKFHCPINQRSKAGTHKLFEVWSPFENLVKVTDFLLVGKNPNAAAWTEIVLLIPVGQAHLEDRSISPQWPQRNRAASFWQTQIKPQGIILIGLAWFYRFIPGIITMATGLEVKSESPAPQVPMVSGGVEENSND